MGKSKSNIKKAVQKGKLKFVPHYILDREIVALKILVSIFMVDVRQFGNLKQIN